MNIYPAIDLYQGQVVRLLRGNYAKKTVYSDHPEKVALEWEKQGAQWLHVVDLEGAQSGKLKNADSLIKIREAVGIQIQLGGGLRTAEDIQFALDRGINRVVIGTKAMDPDFFEYAMARFGSKIAVGLDINAGDIKTQGWRKASGKTFEDAIQYFNQSRLQTLIYTDIQKDGMLEGPNFTRFTEVLKMSKANVILSGGVTTLEDVQKCANMRDRNFDGVIIGKAIYENILTVADAIHFSAPPQP